MAAQHWVVRLFASEGSFAAWCFEHWPRLTWTTHSRYLHGTGDLGEAEDVVQDAWLAVLEERRLYRGRRASSPDELGMLLFGAARSLASNLVKKKRRQTARAELQMSSVRRW